ncbi:conjugal transfer protein TraN [Geobacter sp. FeAm09]|uniref:conjugal transfer protein TraN n=1 Tax=Geobacter sp. FeAm09 TaxID=2597769 RepID=UPI00143DA8F4|nr:conjugal transfer protein TraN [Geobacter sp. FeAm09]
MTDTPTGQNDKNNDGAHDANGNCLGQIYLFNGNDMRCRLYDRNGMLNSYAKLVAQIVLAATGVGAALGAALAVSAGISTTVATAIVNTVINTAVNACIDAATGQFNASSTLISMGISAIGQALPSLGSYLKDNLGSSGLVNSDAIASNIDISPGSLQVDPQFAPAVGTSEGFANLADALQGSGTFLDAAAQQASTPAFYQYLQQLQALTDQYSPAISQGMLGNYSETKCCYPNKLSGGCESSEIQEATEQHNGMCHIVGSYCSSRLLGICMVNKQTSCCFQSQLARIMHEQGRPQLQSFSSGWGSAQSPICRGFTPEEFQALNFSIMDLSEWEKSLNENMSKITPMVQGFINSTGSAAAQSIQSSPAYKAVP